jgi:hypothetical protein
MTDEPARTAPPSISHTTLISQADRLRDEGIPTKIDKHFLIGMAGGTQYQFRHALRSLGFITEDDRPTPLLEKFVKAEQADRSAMFGEIMRERFPDLMNLPDNASKSDLLSVFQGYGVTSPDQHRKMLAFYVAAADYAGLPTSPHVRPTKARTGPRRPRTTTRARKKSAGASSPTPEDSSHAETAGGDAAALTDEQMRSMYFRLLMKKAEQAENDEKLLDRLQDLLADHRVDGKGRDRGRKTAGSTPATPTDPASQGEG